MIEQKGKGKGDGKHFALEGCGPREVRLVDTARSTIDGHGFLETVAIAYNFHQDLVLRPDDIWLLISKGLATHINTDPEQYRHLLVDFEGKRKITVETDDVVPGLGLKNDWMASGVFGEFSRQIRKETGDTLHRTLVADFSTTTPLDRAVSEIVLMDTVKAFFEFEVVGTCGIPHVILEGTVE